MDLDGVEEEEDEVSIDDPKVRKALGEDDEETLPEEEEDFDSLDAAF